ncbi:MAG TPA: VOC family protein, partial [Spirochaetia bacterium]|nr:VOC family protein [Spirochaetia bacterium]
MARRIVPCLWFNNTAKEAVDFYLSVFKDGRILSMDRYTEVG